MREPSPEMNSAVLFMLLAVAPTSFAQTVSCMFHTRSRRLVLCYFLVPPCCIPCVCHTYLLGFTISIASAQHNIRALTGHFKLSALMIFWSSVSSVDEHISGQNVMFLSCNEFAVEWLASL